MTNDKHYGEDIKFLCEAYMKLERAYGQFMLVRGNNSAALDLWSDDPEGLARLKRLLKEHQ